MVGCVTLTWNINYSIQKSDDFMSNISGLMMVHWWAGKLDILTFYTSLSQWIVHTFNFGQLQKTEDQLKLAKIGVGCGMTHNSTTKSTLWYVHKINWRYFLDQHNWNASGMYLMSQSATGLPSHTGTFSQNYIHSTIHAPTHRGHKKHKRMRSLNPYDWCIIIQPYLK